MEKCLRKSPVVCDGYVKYEEADPTLYQRVIWKRPVYYIIYIAYTFSTRFNSIKGHRN